MTVALLAESAAMNCKSMLVVAGLTGVTLFAADAPGRKWNFEDATPGSLPAGWTSAKTGEGPGSVWQVQLDASSPHGAKTLAQTSSAGPSPLFNLCVTDGPKSANVDLSVSFKAIKGEIDTGGGLVWRYQDAQNYYVARLNPLEDNFRLYKVVAGKRKQLANANTDLPAGQWHTLRVVHRGDQIQCHLNGKLLLEGKDTEISQPGRIGFWTKADAVTAFDGLTAGEAK
jgi:hypothetical protein